MPQVRKLEDDEIAQLRRRGARVDLAPYLAGLAELEVGDWGLAEVPAAAPARRGGRRAKS